MKHPHNRGDRQMIRKTKGLRRLKLDQAEHGKLTDCPCFSTEANRGHGRTFARFADSPTLCSGPCCGNPRRWFGEKTIQERRHLQDAE